MKMIFVYQSKSQFKHAFEEIVRNKNYIIYSLFYIIIINMKLLYYLYEKMIKRRCIHSENFNNLVFF